MASAAFTRVLTANFYCYHEHYHVGEKPVSAPTYNRDCDVRGSRKAKISEHYGIYCSCSFSHVHNYACVYSAPTPSVSTVCAPHDRA